MSINFPLPLSFFRNYIINELKILTLIDVNFGSIDFDEVDYF